LTPGLLMKKLPMSDESTLVAAAAEVRLLSYSPYSGFAVGAALLTVGGGLFTACNVENVSYGLSVCAERAAILKAVSEGERDFAALAVVCDASKGCVPCGACLQFLAEFNPQLKLILADTAGACRITSVAELLPEPFGGNSG